MRAPRTNPTSSSSVCPRAKYPTSARSGPTPPGTSASAAPTRFPSAPTPKAAAVAGTVTRTGADGLGQQDAAAVGNEGEGGQPGALTPLRGHRQHGDDRQDDRHRHADGQGELAVGELFGGRPGDDGAGGEDGGDAEAGQQPAPGRVSKVLRSSTLTSRVSGSRGAWARRDAAASGRSVVARASVVRRLGRVVVMRLLLPGEGASARSAARAGCRRSAPGTSPRVRHRLRRGAR